MHEDLRNCLQVKQVFCQTVKDELACPTSIGGGRNAEKAPAGT